MTTHTHTLSFYMQDKGDSTDGSSKSYVLHSDSEDEMLEWLKALKEEMKPMLDGNKHEAIPNGRGPTPPAKATKGGKGKAELSDVKIDPLAFNEVIYYILI